MITEHFHLFHRANLDGGVFNSNHGIEENEALRLPKPAPRQEKGVQDTRVRLHERTGHISQNCVCPAHDNRQVQRGGDVVDHGCIVPKMAVLLLLSGRDDHAALLTFTLAFRHNFFVFI